MIRSFQFFSFGNNCYITLLMSFLWSFQMDDSYEAKDGSDTAGEHDNSSGRSDTSTSRLKNAGNSGAKLSSMRWPLYLWPAVFPFPSCPISFTFFPYSLLILSLFPFSSCPISFSFFPALVFVILDCVCLLRVGFLSSYPSGEIRFIGCDRGRLSFHFGATIYQRQMQY